MAIFNPITPEQLKRDFVYRGWMFGFVPVYVGPLTDEPGVSTRNGVPEWLLDLGEALFAGYCVVGSYLVRGFEPSFTINITERLDGKPIAEGEL